EVLVDELPEPGLAVGRSYRDSPGIDGLVYVETDGTARVGEWMASTWVRRPWPRHPWKEAGAFSGWSYPGTSRWRRR
ncbi:hypothetical protein, partial [Thermus scotoductus]|uniref:hypothetical protein n=1 Tax=Thermus scotoductus TaxID=37636 RepID=UPI001C12BE3A